MEQQDWSIQLASQSTLRPRVAAPAKSWWVQKLSADFTAD
jgi:hypothetical protein